MNVPVQEGDVEAGFAGKGELKVWGGGGRGYDRVLWIVERGRTWIQDFLCGCVIEGFYF